MSAKNIINKILENEQPVTMRDRDGEYELQVTFGPKFEGPMGREYEPWDECNCSIRVVDFKPLRGDLEGRPDFDEYTNSKETGETIPASRQGNKVQIYTGEWSVHFEIVGEDGGPQGELGGTGPLSGVEREQLIRILDTIGGFQEKIYSLSDDEIRSTIIDYVSEQVSYGPPETDYEGEEAKAIQELISKTS